MRGEAEDTLCRRSRCSACVLGREQEVASGRGIVAFVMNRNIPYERCLLKWNDMNRRIGIMAIIYNVYCDFSLGSGVTTDEPWERRQQR